MAQGPHNAGSRLLLALSLCVFGALGSPGRACAEPRFGDSTWVAPTIAIVDEPDDPGPRVAEPDHERTWETVLRMPFRVVFFPLKMLVRGIEATGSFVESRVPQGAVTRAGAPKRGLKFSPEYLGATAAYQQFAGPGSKVALTGTWEPGGNRKLRLRGHVGDRVSPAGAGFEGLYDYRPSRRFYGIGNFSDSRTTYYRRQIDAGSVYAFLGKDHLRRARVTLGISDMKAARGSGTTPRSAEIFSEAEAPFLERGTRVSWIGSSANLAAVDDSLEPSRGIHFRPDVRRYRSTDGSDLRYDQWRIEARGYLPVFARRRVLAAKLVYEGVDRRGGSAPIPFYRLPESTDDDRFGAYPSGRFRDQRLALGRAEYRWEVLPPVWAFLLGELGEVASTPSRLSLRSAHPSLGGGLRARIGQTQLAKFEVARGHEGLNLKFDLGATF